jgi:hypothetical protein
MNDSGFSQIHIEEILFRRFDLLNNHFQDLQACT